MDVSTQFCAPLSVCEKNCELNGPCLINATWKYWPIYHDGIVDFFNFLDSKPSQIWNDCYERLKAFTGGDKRIFCSNNDLYYFPKAHARKAVPLLESMRRFQFTFEIVIPNIMVCVSQPGEIFTMRSYLDWGGRRDDAMEGFRATLWL